MTTVNVYLTFNGQCLDAFEFYKSVFGGEYNFIGKFKDMPIQEGMKPISEEDSEKIMHVSLPISKETILMGSDSGGDWAMNLIQGNNFSVSVSTDTTEEAKRIFDQLSEGGQITMALQKTFWQSYYGMLIDKFGINWMISCELQEHKQFEEENKIKNS